MSKKLGLHHRGTDGVYINFMHFLLDDRDGRSIQNGEEEERGLAQLQQ